MAKYNVGDRVTIRRDLKHDARYDGLFCNSDMEKLCGKQMTISRVLHGGDGVRDDYKLLEDDMGWIWCNAMFEDDAAESVDPISLDISSIL